MTTITAPAKGHCSECGKIWTLNERQGICQWCSKPASCQTTRTKPRRLKSIRSRKRNQENNGSNGYDQLCDQQGWIATDEGFKWGTVHWTTFYEVANKYAHKAMAQDKYDLLHTIMERLTEVELKANGAKSFTIGTMHRIASHCVADYWRSHYNATNGLNCGACGQKQRRACREDDLYSQCPKAIRVESLNQPIIDNEGNITELGDTIADPDSVDIPVWEQTSVWQIGYKVRLVAIGLKLNRGEALSHGEQCYLSRLRKENQKRLIE